jgi:sarcosine oxidase, subunit beta
MNIDEFDVVVIGGGIMGLSTLYHLVTKSTLKVALLERSRLGSGSTNISGGFVRGFHTTNQEISWAVETLKFLREYEKETGFHKIGCYYIADGLDINVIKNSLKYLNQCDEEANLCTEDSFIKNIPQLRKNKRNYIIYEPNSGYADPLKTSLFYADLAKNFGATIFECAEVDYLENNNGYINVQVKKGNNLKTRFVHVCLGAWSANFLNKIGINSLVRAKRIQADTYLSPKNNFPEHCLLDFTTDIFTRPFGMNQQLLGTATHEFDIDVDKYSLSNITQQKLCLEKLKGIVELNNEIKSIGGRIGFDGYLDDFKGKLYSSETMPSISISEGWSGAGFKMAHGVGNDSAKLILSKLES